MTGTSRIMQFRSLVLTFFIAALAVSLLAGCGPSSEDPAMVSYAPIVLDDWKVTSTKKGYAKP